MTQKIETEKFYQEKVNQAIDYIHSNILEDISIGKIAEECSLSKYHFHRIFKAYTNESPGQYIKRTRIERAARLMDNPNLSIEEIGYMVGYNVPSSFTKAFNQIYGISPTKYRNSKQIKITMNITENDKLNISYEIKTLPTCKLAYTRAKGWYSEINYSKIIPKLYKTAILHFSIPLRYPPMSIYINDPNTTEKENLLTDVGIFVSKEFNGKNDVNCRKFEGGKFLSTTYIGPYSSLSQAYDCVYKHLTQQGLIVRDAPPMEMYWSDPNKTPQDEQKTEILIPIE